MILLKISWYGDWLPKCLSTSRRNFAATFVATASFQGGLNHSTNLFLLLFFAPWCASSVIYGRFCLKPGADTGFRRGGGARFLGTKPFTKFRNKSSNFRNKSSKFRYKNRAKRKKFAREGRKKFSPPPLGNFSNFLFLILYLLAFSRYKSKAKLNLKNDSLYFSNTS